MIVFLLLQSLLDEPNPNSPANSLAAQMYQENRREYEKRVQQIVEQSWLNFTENDGPEEKKPDTDSSSAADGTNSQSTSRGDGAEPSIASGDSVTEYYDRTD